MDGSAPLRVRTKRSRSPLGADEYAEIDVVKIVQRTAKGATNETAEVTLREGNQFWESKFGQFKAEAVHEATVQVKA